MKKVHLCQVNNLYGKNAFLPYSVGLLQAYAQTIPVVKDNYEFTGFVYLREPIEDIINRLDNPDVFGISCYIWNHTYSLALAKAVKESFPNCLIVLGGPHIPNRSEGYFSKYPYVDILVHNEGEITFADILIEKLSECPDYTNILGVSIKASNYKTYKTPDRPRTNDLDKLPSPYLSGVFDDIINDPYELHPTQEVVRGCPYFCQFCVSEGTLVMTPKGNKKIEDLIANDVILGYNEKENKLSWNIINKSVYMGKKQTFNIKTERELYVEATSEHPFYTKRGWKTTKELRIGDEVLSWLWDNDKQKKEILFNSMPYEKRKSHAKSRVFGKNGGNAEEKHSKRKNNTFYVHSKGSTNNERNGERKTVWTWQPDERPRDKCKVWTDKQGKKFSNDIQENERIQSNEKSRIKIESSHCIKQPRNTKEICKELLHCSSDSSKQIRKENHRFSRKKRNALQVCRRFSSMDNRGRNKEKQKSRFRSHRRKHQESNISSWSLLAQRPRRCKKRIGTLQTSRMGMFHNLGKRKFRRNITQSVERVRWKKITSITPQGIKNVYDIFDAKPTHNFFANGILVSNCDWGSNTFSKLKSFSLERIVEEIRWFAEHKLDLLYNADANVGIFERDLEIIKEMVGIKEKYGYPKKFRAAYAKNSNERVFQIAKILNDADMNKGVTLSFQSMDDNTLEIIKRKNIKVKDFKNLMQRYRAEGIPTYSEIIVGLPGETYDSFADGLELLVSSGQHSSISIYTCEVLPNAGLNDPEYREKHGIKSMHVPVLFFHGTPSHDPYQEHYELVTSTNMLPEEDWLKCQRFSWAIQCYHCLSLTQAIAVFLFTYKNISYRTFYEALLKLGDDNPDTLIGKVGLYIKSLFQNILDGKEWGVIDQRFGDLVWPPEEGGFLKFMAEKDKFYQELTPFLKSFIDDDLTNDLIKYQKAILIDPWAKEIDLTLNHNIHEFVQAAYEDRKIELEKTETIHHIVVDKCYNGDIETYAREVVWYGRKSGKFTHKVK